MTGLFSLSKAQISRIEPYFPLSHGVPRVDDRRIVSAIICVIRNGLVGVMRLPLTVRTRRSITASSGGADWAC